MRRFATSFIPSRSLRKKMRNKWLHQPPQEPETQPLPEPVPVSPPEPVLPLEIPVEKQSLIEFYPSHNPKKGSKSIILISHDANRGGASLLMLKIGSIYKDVYGFNVINILLNGGPVFDSFRDIGDIHLLNASHTPDTFEREDIVEFFRELKKTSPAVLANTTVSGFVTKSLKTAGMHVVSLVHELPPIISQMKLEEAARHLAKYSDEVVFACKAVRDRFPALDLLNPKKITILEQGFTHFSQEEASSSSRQKFRARWGLYQDAKIVLGCGSSGMLKGIDLFIDIARQVCSKLKNTFFLWLGDADNPSLMSWLAYDHKKQGFEQFIYHPEFEQNPSDFFLNSDAYLLTSRIDSFPSTLLEAMNAGIPCATFADTGGGEELLSDGRGTVVPYIDTKAMAEEVISLLGKDADELSRQTDLAIDYTNDFTFERYTLNLLSLLRSACMPDQGFIHDLSTVELLASLTKDSSKKRILHLSSRLTTRFVQRELQPLIEETSSEYNHYFLAELFPKPHGYSHLPVEEIPLGTPIDIVLSRIKSYNPDIIHFHYYDEGDQEWNNRVTKLWKLIQIPVLSTNYNKEDERPESWKRMYKNCLENESR